MVAPTNAELIFWIVIAVIIVGIALYGLIINPYFDPKGDDPYRYCPKEEEE